MKKRFLTLCILCLFCTLLLAGCKHKDHDHNHEHENPNYDTETYLTGKHYVQMDIWEYGSVYLELDADAAPATVTNFMNLVQSSFYNGLTFHRVIDGFMMQGGDPEGTGLGGSEYNVPGEFAVNGYENPISHVRGTISMAREDKNYDSASSQFFIMQQDVTALDGNYAAFGKVLFGMDVIDAVCAYTPVQDANGTVATENQPVIEKIIVVGEELIELLRLQEMANLPATTATISFAPIASTESLPLEATWNIDADGPTYVLFSSEDLISLGLYETDLASGMQYDETAPLAFIENLGANKYIAVNISVPEEDLPTLILIAKEPSGAIGQYLLAYDEYFGGAYLVPVLN